MVCGPNLEEIKALAACPESCVKVVEQEVTVMVHPMYSQSLKKGILMELDAMVNRYSALLGGLPLAYDSPKLLSTHGWLFHTNPFDHLLVSARFYVFAPEVGSVVKGVVKKKSQNHLGCLVHGTFNVSVPRPQDFARQCEVWPGNVAEEGDSVRLKLVEIRFGYYLPFFKAELDPESVEEAVRARQEETGKRITFNDDSGISSNEADEKEEKQKSKLTSEGEASISNVDREEVVGLSDVKEKKKKKKVKELDLKEEIPENEVSSDRKKKKKKSKVFDPKEESPEPKQKKKKEKRKKLDLKEESLEYEETPKQKVKKEKIKEHETLDDDVDISNIKKESLINDNAVPKKKRKRIDEDAVQEKDEDERPRKKKRKLPKDLTEDNVLTLDSPNTKRRKVKKEEI